MRYNQVKVNDHREFYLFEGDPDIMQQSVSYLQYDYKICYNNCRT
jgi:hypothetical protein